MKIYSILRKGKLNESGLPVRSGEDFIESVIAKKLFESGGESYIAPDGNTYEYRYDVVDNYDTYEDALAHIK